MYVHDLDPFLWQISGDFGIRWYGLSYMAGFICAYYLSVWFAKRQRAELQPAMVADFITYGAIGTLVGGRLGYCLFYAPDLFFKFKSSIPFWGVLAVNEGGMASHGGMIGIVVACWLFARRYHISHLYLFDLVATVGPIGVLFGRIANFINGELVGRPAEAGAMFSVKFPQDIFTWPSTDPAKLTSLSDVVDKLGISRDMWLEWMQKYNSDAGIHDKVNSVLFQVVEAIQNGNTAVKAAIEPLLLARHPSQLYAAAGEGLFLFLVLFITWYKPRKPGTISSVFVIMYAIVRIAGEQFRMPDAHIGYQLFGLTRGQWLSIGMLVIGLMMLLIFNRRASLKSPGWGLGQNIRLNRK
jgi:phosphatidylglycerol---prolipoprotein diacylglyceryl transferase